MPGVWRPGGAADRRGGGHRLQGFGFLRHGLPQTRARGRAFKVGGIIQGRKRRNHRTRFQFRWRGEFLIVRRFGRFVRRQFVRRRLFVGIGWFLRVVKAGRSSVPPEGGRLGILVGTGELPYLAARNALAAGEDLRLFPFTNEPPPDDLRQYCTQVVLIRIFSSVIRTMKAQGVKRLLLLGKADRAHLYRNRPWSFDWRVLFLLARSANQNDYTIFDVLSREFEKRGIHIIAQDSYLQDQFLPEGRYGGRLTKREIEDIVYGMEYARELNRLDVGQTVVVGKRSVLALEAAEGTDLCIRRGGELFHGRGAVVCKTAKRNHDARFDIPVTGLSTLESMSASGCRVLAIEAGRTFVVNPVVFLEQARALGITVVSLNPERTDRARVSHLNRRAARLAPGSPVRRAGAGR